MCVVHIIVEHSGSNFGELHVGFQGKLTQVLRQFFREREIFGSYAGINES